LLVSNPRIPNGVCSDENEGATTGCHFGLPLPVQISATSGGVSQVEKILPGGLIAFRTGCPKNILLAENAFI
jgi:hypothetical protein